MGYAGFRYPTESFDEKYYGHIVAKLSIVAPGWYVSGYLTSETLLAFAAREVSLGLFPGRMFDIRILGAIHALLLASRRSAFFVRACRDLWPAAQVVAAALLVLVYTDVGYAAPLNSFFAQTASLLFVLLTFACARSGVRKAGSADWLSSGTSRRRRSSSARSLRSSCTRRSSRASEFFLAAKSPARRSRPARAVGLAAGLCVLASGTTGRSLRPASATSASSTRSSTTSCSTRPIRAGTWRSSGSTPISPATSACTRTWRKRRSGIPIFRSVFWTVSATRRSWRSTPDTPVGSSTGSAEPRRRRSGSARSISAISRSRRACLRAPGPPASRSGAICGRGVRRMRSAGSSPSSAETCLPRRSPGGRPRRGDGSSCSPCSRRC